jgi:hypothetical protein
MRKTLALCGFAGFVATSEQLISIIFKMVLKQGEMMLGAYIRARNKYKEKVVHLCHLFRKAFDIIDQKIGEWTL